MCSCKDKTLYNPCNVCNTSPCTPEAECDCPVKDLSTDCSKYTGEDLECSGIKKGTILTELIQQLDAFICEKFNDLANLLTIKNIGAGAKVYKGTDLVGRKELRTVTKTGDLLEVTENVDDINLTINETVLNTFIEENQKTYSVENLGTGAEVYKSTDTIVGDNTEFNLRTLEFETFGDELEIVKEVIQGEDTIKVVFKDFKSNTLTVTENEDSIFYDTPSSNLNLAFYVDENSTADNETGTSLMPFKTINKALDTFVGTGTWYNPEFKGYKIELLSNCELKSTAGIDYNAYVNLDVNNLIIEGNTNTLGIYSNISMDYYPISTRRMVSGIPKTAGVLDFEIIIELKNLTVERKGTNAIVDHLNYAFPTVTLVSALSPIQNGSSIKLENVILINNTDREEDTSPNWDLLTGVTFFGQPIYVSNVENIGVPMFKTQARSWNREGGVTFTGTIDFNNSTGTCFKIIDTTFNTNSNVSMGRLGNLRYYDTVVDDYYSPRTDLYFLEIDSDVNFCTFLELKVGLTIPRALTTEVSPRTVQIGGSDALSKITNNSSLTILKGRTEEQYYNTFIIDGNSIINLDSWEDLSHSEDIHGTFKIIAPLPLIGKVVSIYNSDIKEVIVDETETDLSYIKEITGFNNIINSAPHSTYTSYLDDTTAKANGLIKGNVYYNTTVGALKQIL